MSIQYPALTGPIHSGAPAETLGGQWTPVFPAWVARRRPHASWAGPCHIHVDPPAVAAGPGGSSPATGSLPILQYQGIASPLIGIPPLETPKGWHEGQAPALVPRIQMLHASQHPAWAADKFTAPTAATVTPLSWTPRYPDFPWAPRRLREVPPFTIEVKTPTPSAAPGLSWGPLHHGRPLTPRLTSYAHLLWSEQHFGYIVDVPVMSWTGEFPALVPSRRYSTPPGQAFGFLFVPDVTQPSPPLTWEPDLPDRVFPKARLASSAQTAFFWHPATFDPATAPDAFQAFYPDQVWGRGRRALLGGISEAFQPPDVARTFGLDPSYPDFITRPRLHPSSMQVEGWGVFTPAPPTITPGRRPPNVPRRPFRLRYRR